MLGLLLAIGPLVLPLVALGVTGAAVGATLYLTRGRRRKLTRPDKRKELPSPDPNGEEDELPETAEVIDAYTGRFMDGVFFPIVKGDAGISDLVRRTLNAIDPGAGDVPAMVRAVKQLMNRGAWNRSVYVEPSADIDAVDGGAINKAWLPKHENAVATMRLGFYPVRNIDAVGVRVGQAVDFGAPWVPKLNHAAVKERVTDQTILLADDWDDGTEATEPPPDVHDALEKR